MKDLIIITTKPDFLPQDTNGEGIFSKIESCKELPAKALNEMQEKSRDRALWQLKAKGQLVFATACLDRDKRPESDFVGKDKKPFIRALLEDVAAVLSNEEKKGIERIFLFAHGFDIDHSRDSLAPIESYSFFEETDLPVPNEKPTSSEKEWASTTISSWLSSLFLDKDIRFWDNKIKRGNNEIEVFLTAFSHSGNSFFNLLEKGTRPLGYEPGKKSLSETLTHIGESLRGWFEEKESMKEFKYDKPLPTLPFSFKFFYPEAEGLTEKQPEDFPFTQIQKDMKEQGKGKDIVNIVFLPLAAMGEYEKGNFFKKVKKLCDAQGTSFPTLFIGFKNIMADSQTSIPLDPRFKFLDSSIWYRYVPILNIHDQEQKLVGHFSKNLQFALDTIGWAYENRLYVTNVCREFLEFQNRLVENSRLDDTFGSGHANRVFPFTFHSESAMGEKAELYAIEFSVKKLQWNFRLVDDYADHSLREGDNDGTGRTKGEIVRKLLESNPKKDMSACHVIVPEKEGFTKDLSAESARKSLGCHTAAEIKARQEGGIPSTSAEMTQNVTDIVLLDYLFSLDENNQHFGTQLLYMIKEASERIGLSVLQSFWIYPISVFNEAIQSDLQEKGYQHLEKYWHLARGADPLNTPHLFRYTLFDFMNSQAEKILFEEKDLWEFWSENTKLLLNIHEALPDRKIPAVSKTLNRGMAIQAFRRFIERFSMDEGLPEGSALGKSAHALLQDSKATELRDHMRQLLYLLGFSAGFDFPVIEREYLAIQHAFDQFDFNKQLANKKISIENSMRDLSVAVYSISGKYF